MTSRRTSAQRFAVAALALFLAGPAAAEAPSALSDALDAAGREAGAMRRHLTLVQLSPDAAIRIEQRIAALERTIRALTDKVESLDAKHRDLLREFERYKNDTEYRLNQLDRGGARPPANRGEAEPERRPAPPRRAENGGGRERAALPGATAREQYEHALALLRRSDYPGAQAALAQFVKRFPKDPLSGSAYYWLGETYYAQGRFQDAAFNYADCYRRFPNHPKAENSLFKLGLSFARLGKKSEACATFGEFRRRYPQSGMRREADAEARRLDCRG